MQALYFRLIVYLYEIDQVIIVKLMDANGWIKLYSLIRVEEFQFYNGCFKLCDEVNIMATSI